MLKQKRSDFQALRSILPAKRNDLRVLLYSGGFVLLILVCGGGLYYNDHRQQLIRNQDWTSAIATIEDAHAQVAMRVDSQAGGAMLYEVAVLVKYSTEGVEREQWTTIRQHPQLLEDAQFQIFRLKKQQCTVRWNPSHPDHIIAEAN